MGEVSWIKLKVGMFDDSKIKYIEALPERDTIITIWVKLLTLSGKYNEQGYIMLSENLPYNEEMLANEFNRPINSIRLAIQTFETLGMIEKVNGVIKVTNWEKHQSLDSKAKHKEKNKLRQQRYRERQKKLLEEKSNVTVTLCNDTEEEEKEEEYKKKEEEREAVFSSSIKYIIANLDDKLTPNQMEQLGFAIDDIGTNAFEVVKVGVAYTKSKSAHGGYLIKVLNNWAKENVKTKEDAENKITPRKNATDDVIAQMEKELSDD
ncbi:TPA: phage replisome organizer N-terminal domain-containing protein [Staphylococcus aureus]|uniref:phage replisome organizer N-terminal domain-containing protein n=1 Tax=Staphylococcus aureus TaxID=1280 RepID=UPI000AED8C9F|nr:phage replisome organizer N-terminal domain-containing protein [Staphylococcus aureus]MBF0831152.1 phage replisome organizer N-terminal domain-containing protein [Staphylococcus aureus]MBU6655068.1 phage replisome organizer N-terminal domain-containing protein [Staphylococcus aureus]MCB8071160.1 phage replisome organizer N-terminal domain-containing protein [Staphylococcus aureus]UIZ46946.1 phage replisome organizer N-terminal domain-containing protein [Staphylococcus aureus]HBC4647249.1 ph